MKLKISFAILQVFSIIIFSSCEQDSISTLETETLVLESYLFAGQAVDSVRVTKSIIYSQESDTIVTYDDLDIKIEVDGYNYDLITIGNGFYKNPSLIVEEKKDYKISFEHNEVLIWAQTYVPQVDLATISSTEINMEKIESGTPGGPSNQTDPIEITWENSNGDYYYVLVENMEQDPEYINGNLEDLLEEGEEIRRFSFRSEPEIMDLYAIDTRREIQQFGTHRVIVFHVNPEYAALYEISGNSSLSLTEAPTNVENGLGIFTGISSDTLYFEVKKL